LVNEDGSLGPQNDLRCVSLEHKLGIHGSPTCVMAYGDNGGAVGYLVGEENRGMECMFTMMNNARLNVGLQGVAVAERAYQQARDFARQRVQGRPAGVKADGPLPIIHHADVRRMLLDMRAMTEAARALTYETAGAIDRARHHPDGAERARQQKRADLLIPVVKAWCTDRGVDVASLGVQVHGGMGFIEETGAAQHLRDARIAPIYEGTNGIQANDLVVRKLGRDGGASAREFIAEMRALDGALGAAPGDDLDVIRRHLAAGLDTLASATDWMATTIVKDMGRALAGSVPYLALLGTVTGGWLLAKGALAAQAALAARPSDSRFLEAKLLTARFFGEHRLAVAPGMLPAVIDGATVVGFDPDLL
jgi:3-(methylthio)propanoyl-CoA dehydrogenase